MQTTTIKLIGGPLDGGACSLDSLFDGEFLVPVSIGFEKDEPFEEQGVSGTYKVREAEEPLAVNLTYKRIDDNRAVFVGVDR